MGLKHFIGCVIRETFSFITNPAMRLKIVNVATEKADLIKRTLLLHIWKTQSMIWVKIFFPFNTLVGDSWENQGGK